MILEKLRAHTKETHQALEESMLPYIKGVNDTNSYTQLLRMFYGFYKPLQDQVDKYIDKTILPDYDESRRAEWILEDLQAIHQPTNDIPLYQLPFSINSHAAALGALYVTEGSTLGGKVICKMIATNLGKGDMEGLKFFNGYGANTSSRWKNFLLVLNAERNLHDEEVMIESAEHVFAGFADWLKKS